MEYLTYIPLIPRYISGVRVCVSSIRGISDISFTRRENPYGLRWYSLNLILKERGGVIEVEPLGRIGGYNAVQVSLSTPYMSNLETEEVLRKVLEDLKTINTNIGYVNLSYRNIAEVFVEGFKAALSGKDVIIAHYTGTVDPLIILVNAEREDLLVSVLETTIRILDKVVKTSLDLRRTIRRAAERLQDVVIDTRMEIERILFPGRRSP